MLNLPQNIGEVILYVNSKQTPIKLPMTNMRPPRPYNALIFIKELSCYNFIILVLTQGPALVYKYDYITEYPSRFI